MPTPIYCLITVRACPSTRKPEQLAKEIGGAIAAQIDAGHTRALSMSWLVVSLYRKPENWERLLSPRLRDGESLLVVRVDPKSVAGSGPHQAELMAWLAAAMPGPAVDLPLDGDGGPPTVAEVMARKRK